MPLKDILEESRRSGKVGRIAADLVQASDKEGISVEAFSKDDTLLQFYGINKRAITPEAISEAQLIGRRWWREMQSRIDALNGKAKVMSKPQKQPSPLIAVTLKILRELELPATFMGLFRASKVLEEKLGLEKDDIDDEFVQKVKEFAD